MGIYDREYMRPTHGNRQNSGRSESIEGRLERLIVSIFGKSKRFLILLVFIIIALVIVGLSTH